jgi:hypothetical protein
MWSEAGNDPAVRLVQPVILSLLDALDEMECERDKANALAVEWMQHANNRMNEKEAAEREGDEFMADVRAHRTALGAAEYESLPAAIARLTADAERLAADYDRVVGERDAALKSRIATVEVRPGDAIVYRLHGATEIVANGSDEMERVRKYVRAMFDEFGFAGVKVLIIDGEDSVSALRPTPEDAEGEAIRRKFRYDEDKRGDR